MPKGSFGLGGVRIPSSGSDGHAHAHGAAPLASLGGGRATVPLAFVSKAPTPAPGSRPVTNRVASDSRPVSSARSSPPPQASTPTPPAASPKVERALTPEPEPEPEPIPVIDHTTATPTWPRTEMLRSDSNASGVTTPGSVSSLYVETGSMTSDVGPDPSSLSTPTPTAGSRTTSRASSPLSSPIVDATMLDEDVPRPLDLDLRSAASLKGPLTSLKVDGPSRSSSTVSMSSMFVETGSDADAGDVPTPGAGRTTPTPTSIPATPAPADDDDVEKPTAAPVETEEEHDDAKEMAREVSTQNELDAYEQEETDITAAGSSSLVAVATVSDWPATDDANAVAPRPTSEAATPREEPVVEVKEPSTPPALSNFAPLDLDTPAPADEGSGMPTVKCSDCGNLIDLMELSDHSCGPSQRPPALSASQPSSPSITLQQFASPPSPAISTSSSSHRAPPPDAPSPDVYPDRAEPYQPIPFRTSTGSAPRSPSFRTPSPSASRGNSTEMGRGLSSSSTSSLHSLQSASHVPATSLPTPRSLSTSSNQSRFASKLDSFVQHPTAIVPDDEEDDAEGDPYDLDDLVVPESPTDPPASGGGYRTSGSSSFISVPEGTGGRRSARGASSDLPEDEAGQWEEFDYHEAVHAPLFNPGSLDDAGAGGAGRRAPAARYAVPTGFDDEDEEGYEGGSATIVRTTATHRSPPLG